MNAALEELSLHIIARERLRRPEVSTRDLKPSAAEFELSESCVVKGIASEAIAAPNGSNLFEPPFRAIPLSDCDRPVKCDYGRLAYRHQGVIERYDCSPVRVFDSMRN